MFSGSGKSDIARTLEALDDNFGYSSAIVKALDRIKDAVYETSSVIENKSEPVQDGITSTQNKESKALEDMVKLMSAKEKSGRTPDKDICSITPNENVLDTPRPHIDVDMLERQGEKSEKDAEAALNLSMSEAQQWTRILNPSYGFKPGDLGYINDLIEEVDNGTMTVGIDDRSFLSTALYKRDQAHKAKADGLTPTAYLVLSVRQRNFGTVYDLIRKGISIYQSDWNGRCALTVAELREDTDMLIFLKQRHEAYKHIDSLIKAKDEK